MSMSVSGATATLPTVLFVGGVGASFLGGLTHALSPSKKVFPFNPNIDSLSFLSRRDTNSSSIAGSGISEKQLDCAERLGVDISECNQFGVFINRTKIVGDEILKFSSVNTWENVTSELLEDIWALRTLGDKGVTTLQPYDFNGLTRLTRLYLHKNQIQEFPEGIFDPLESLHTLQIDENEIESLDKDIFANTKHIRRVYLFENPLTLSESTFKAFQKIDKDFSIHYQFSSEDDRVVAISFNNNHDFVQVANISSLFRHGSDAWGGYLYPGDSRLPDYGYEIVPQIRRFICTFLLDELGKKVLLESESQNITVCASNRYFTDEPPVTMETSVPITDVPINNVTQSSEETIATELPKNSEGISTNSHLSTTLVLGLIAYFSVTTNR